MVEYETDALCVLTAEAARFFAAAVDDSWVPGYLAGRGFGPEIWRPWAIGYAPAGWSALTDHLRGLGFSAPVIEAAGLARRSARGSLIDIFRDRMMFPVRAVDGAVTGFIGRAPPGARAGPVYLNSPTTPLYHKGNVLFGLPEALSALAEGARPVIAEGPLDAIAITAAAGRTISVPHSTIPTAVPAPGPAFAPGSCPRYVGVASCGTALTRTQAALLAAPAPRPDSVGPPTDTGPLGGAATRVGGPGRAATRVAGPRGKGTRVAGPGGVIVAFDGDRAGRRAAVRAFDLFRDDDGNGEVSAALLPEGVDPAGYFRDHGAAALAALLDEAVPLADLVIDASLAEFDRWLEFTDGRFAALRAAAPLVACLPAAQVARQVARVADHLDLSYAEVTEAVTSALTHLIAEVPDGGRRVGRRRGG